jgi:hypothetical protein
MKKSNTIIRILILLSVFISPWWVAVILACAGVFYFDRFYEIILIGLFFDILYHSTNTAFGLYGFTIIACVLFVTVKQIKQRLIVY